jgi:hypothetical protein
MKGNENLTKERFCRDEELKKGVTKEGMKARKEGHKNLKKKKTMNMKEGRKERTDIHEALGSMPTHLP